MKCKYCNSEFEAPTRGRKREYCYKDECIKKARAEACKKYQNKLKETKEPKEGAKNVKKLELSNEVKEGGIPYVVGEFKKIENSVERRDYAEPKISSEYVGELRGIAREINALRYKIFEKYQELGREQSIYDKEDSDFLHLIEDIDLDDVNALEKIRQAKESRKNRRSTKERQRVLHTLLNSLPENAEKLVLDLVQAGENSVYKPRINERGEVNERSRTNNYNKTKRQSYNNYRKW